MLCVSLKRAITIFHPTFSPSLAPGSLPSDSTADLCPRPPACSAFMHQPFRLLPLQAIEVLRTQVYSSTMPTSSSSSNCLVGVVRQRAINGVAITAALFLGLVPSDSNAAAMAALGSAFAVSLNTSLSDMSLTQRSARGDYGSDGTL